MGSATKQALKALSDDLGTWQGADMHAARELLDLVERLGAAPQVRTALAEPDADQDRKRALIERLFGPVAGEPARALLGAAAARRWSDDADFGRGVQELGVRAVAQFSGQAPEMATQLLSAAEAIGEHGELELALSSKLTSADAKRQLADRLFGGKVSEATMIVLRHLIANPMGRRARRALAWAADVVTDQAKRTVATVTSAVPLPADQVERLQAALSRKYGRDVQIATLVDPAVMGGVRVELGDDVIDDTVAARLHDLRRSIA